MGSRRVLAGGRGSWEESQWKLHLSLVSSSLPLFVWHEVDLIQSVWGQAVVSETFETVSQNKSLLP